MAFKRDNRENGDQALLEARRSEAAPLRGKSEPNVPAADQAVGLRAPARREQPFEADEDHERQEPTVGDETRKGWLRRHPIAVALGPLLLAIAQPVGYLYWDYTSHFESTDDAYIAARQFALAPEVSGYVTLVPVTDNEHADTGQVIARIDDRPYLAALAQAQAQVGISET